MKKINLWIMRLALGVLCACASINEPEAVDVIRMSESAMGAQSHKTLQHHMLVMLADQKIYGVCDIVYKAPDKCRMEIEIKGIDRNVHIVNGDRVWVKSRLSGVHEMTKGSPEWEQQRFDMSYFSGEPMETNFSGFEFVKPYDDDGSVKFYYVRGMPDRKRWKHIHPVVFKIGKHDHLLYGMETKSYIDDALVSVRSRMSRHTDYGTSDAPFILPNVQVDYQGGAAVVQNLKKLRINEPVDDALFAQPVDEKE